jgi:hypothetical protein
VQPEVEPQVPSLKALHEADLRKGEMCTQSLKFDSVYDVVWSMLSPDAGTITTSEFPELVL